MSEKLSVQSIFRKYHVHFVEDAFGAFSGNLNDTFFMVDRKLLALWGTRVKGALPADRTIGIEANEFDKTLDRCQEIIRSLVEKNVRKNHLLVAVGGGILQDITAFTASILYRGIEWHFIPTTLLAQADSCIGSKTSINLGEFKNLVGNFYPPSEILIDVRFLESLPPGEIKSGIGEILHYYLIDDNPLAESLMARYDEFLATPMALYPFIRESLKIKKRVIERDEFDRHERNLFNYGHTFGHALESLSNYQINHGQAVTFGMDLANFLSVEFGHMTQRSFEKMHQVLEKNIPTLNPDEYEMGKYYEALSRDKKNVEDNLGCILTRGPGKMFKAQIPIDDRLKDLIRVFFNKKCLEN
ncbi:MAG: iron-containing alcohol dehydrogenase [Deltaproteobacteria bacterium]|nr:iron-containing alcohol dehydrogenase [Deltaproteobacteria bacterium]